MATAASRAGKTGRIVAGSTETVRVPNRRSNRERVANRMNTKYPAAATPSTGQYLRTPVYGPKQNKSPVKKISRKVTASVRAFVITMTLLIPTTVQIVIGIMLAASIGFLEIGFIAWALQNFSIFDTSAELFFGGMWVVSIILNLLMFLYCITAFLISGIRIFTPVALVALGICIALSIMPLTNIVPWVLVYVWVVALTS